MGELFAQSRQQLVARDFHHGKQRVSPFYHVSQLLHEKNVFRSPENGMLLLLLFEGKQRVSQFYHDLGLDLVGLIGNFWIVNNFSLGCRATSEPNSLIQSCFKEIFGRGRGDVYTFSYMCAPTTSRDTSCSRRRRARTRTGASGRAGCRGQTPVWIDTIRLFGQPNGDYCSMFPSFYISHQCLSSFMLKKIIGNKNTRR